jgi:hypothetical protein
LYVKTWVSEKFFALTDITRDVREERRDVVCGDWSSGKKKWRLDCQSFDQVFGSGAVSHTELQAAFSSPLEREEVVRVFIDFSLTARCNTSNKRRRQWIAKHGVAAEYDTDTGNGGPDCAARLSEPGSA